MWRKPDEKPASQPSKTPAAVPVSVKPPTVPEPPAAAPPTPAPETRAFRSPAVEPAIPAPVSSTASRINSGLKITGEVFGDSDLVIDGEVQGKVRLSSGRVTVGSSGRVQAEIEAREIVVEGTVQGNLKAADSVRLGPAGRVTGSVLTPRIAIDDGARLRGKVETTPGPQSRGSSLATPVTRVAKELESVTASADSE
ncbi:MAG TPA: polymer-forming cytoskeletal protein [Terriglobia bacterium]|nr:polymer-forming cytoskeletal protein [Terriglobia bacterium]